MKNYPWTVWTAILTLLVLTSPGVDRAAHAQPPDGSPNPQSIQINELNRLVANQSVTVTGEVEAINQTVVQTALNFNLFLKGFPQNSLDPSALFSDLGPVITSLGSLTPSVPGPSTPPGGMPPTQIEQTIIQTGININEPGTMPFTLSTGGVDLNVTADIGDHVSEVDQANFNQACQQVLVRGEVGSLDRTVVQSQANFSRTLTPADGLNLSQLLNAIVFATDTTHTHSDGPFGTPPPGTAPGSVPTFWVNQTIVQTALNFNILTLSSDADLPALSQANANEIVNCPPFQIVPEPASLAILGMCLPVFGIFRRRRA